MKTEDLKEISEKLGDGYSCVLKDGVVLVGKDPFNVVEFVRHRVTGKICKIGSVTAEYLENFEPSTEEAYVNKLKAKAKELYGEIKDGDRFDLSPVNGHKDIESIYLRSSPTFTYSKVDDLLALNGFVLFQRGKWAKKIEPVEVELVRVIKCDGYDYDLIFRLNVKGGFNYLEAGKHLTKSLEDYLNVSQVGAVLI